MKLNTKQKQPWIQVYGFPLCVGILSLSLGWFFRGCFVPSTAPNSTNHSSHNHATTSKKATTWTCSMHPQIKLPKAGKCPICFMDLIPLVEDNKEGSANQVVLSPYAMTLSEIRTQKVIRRPLFRKLSLTGKVAYDETKIKTITSWVSGRLERLYVDYTGVKVRKGDHLVQMYSPELLNAQQELLQALKSYQKAKKGNPQGLFFKMAKKSLSSAKKKLELLGVKKWQIQHVEKKGIPFKRINIYAPMGGIVVQKHAKEGMYVKTGSPVYTLVDLSQVWVVFEAYERDLPWLRKGQEVAFSTLSNPGKQYLGEIVFMDPHLDPKTRTIKVRINVQNPQEELKSGMFVTGIVFVSLDQKGETTQPTFDKQWICPMHPEVQSKKKSRCPICGMSLEKRKQTGKHRAVQDPLVVPETAPLFTGKRSIVYIRVPNKKQPTFEGREVILGTHASPYYVVLSGIQEGEDVVLNGAFKLDSELQIRAKPSMMTLEGKFEKKVQQQIQYPSFSKRFEEFENKALEIYFRLQKALSKDQAKESQASFASLFQQVSLKTTVFPKEQNLLESLRSQLFSVAKQGKKQTVLKEIRFTFQKLSQLWIAHLQQFQHPGTQKIFKAFCPMAFENKGAFWLQRKKTIENSYFGASMFSCGSIQTTFKGRGLQPVSSSRTFLNGLTPLYESYIQLSDTLFKDQLETTLSGWKHLHTLLKNHRENGLNRSNQDKWKRLKKEMLHALNSLNPKQATLETIRKPYGQVSRLFLQMLSIFGHNLKTPLFETYCPMAFQNQGAGWIQSQDKQVQNPYFGAKMAHCGDVKHRYHGRKK